MLLQTYNQKIPALTTSTKQLNHSQVLLLTALQSKSRFEQLMEVLPEDWENKYTINFFSKPSDVAQHFQNQAVYKDHHPIYERVIDSIVVSEKHAAVPGKYDEYLKKDYDYPIAQDKWKMDHDLTELKPASFHIDHKLIWTTKERGSNSLSSEPLEDVEYTYSINVYVPNPSILIDVENLKLNDII